MSCLHEYLIIRNYYCNAKLWVKRLIKLFLLLGYRSSDFSGQYCLARNLQIQRKCNLSAMVLKGNQIVSS